MRLIVGLGNPGEKYKYTRHNCGFMVINSLVKNLTPLSQTNLWQEVKKPKLTYIKIKDDIFLKPLTYMNLSGLAVSHVLNFYKIKKENVWVIYDDIDLPLGKLRIRKGGGSAGHHGIESIIKELKTDNFIRFRLGVSGRMTKGKPERRIDRRVVEKFVLSVFAHHEEGTLRRMIKKTAKALKYSLDEGVEKGMNRYN